MLQAVYTKQFKKDVKRMEKRGKPLNKLKTVIEKLVHKKLLPPHYDDHRLVGNYANHRECHIEPDWLLIYRLFQDVIRLERTGSHSDLFKSK